MKLTTTMVHVIAVYDLPHDGFLKEENKFDVVEDL